MAERVKLLAFDTSSSVCTVALFNDNQHSKEKIITQHIERPMQQGQLILPMIQDLLAKASLTLDQLDAIAYGCGPGSYTGIRIASSVAYGLGLAMHLPLIPVSSLAAIAQAAYLEEDWKSLLVAIDARMNQIYWAKYKVSDSGLVVLDGEEEISAPGEVTPPQGSHWYAVGSGWEIYNDKLVARIGFQPVLVNAAQFPKAEAIAILGQAKLTNGEWLRPADAQPHYLR